MTLDELTPGQLRKIATLKENDASVNSDGNGAFLPDMTHEEYATYLHEETNGWKGFYNKITGKNAQKD